LIDCNEFQKRVNKILKKFREQNKCIASVIIDNDGFILFSKIDEDFETNTFKKNLIDLFSKIELLTQGKEKLINYSSHKEILLYKIIDDYLSFGLMIIFQALNKNLVLFTIFPYLIDSKPILKEFEKLMETLSKYFQELNNSDYLRKLYRIL